MHEALDRIARREGFKAWSLLVNRAFSNQHSKTPLAELRSGDLALIGASPYQGKTHLCLELIVAAMKAGRRGVFFSLEYNPSDIVDSFVAIGESMETYQDRFEFDDSDDICAPYIVERLATAPAETLVVIDSLQLLVAIAGPEAREPEPCGAGCGAQGVCEGAQTHHRLHLADPSQF